MNIKLSTNIKIKEITTTYSDLDNRNKLKNNMNDKNRNKNYIETKRINTSNIKEKLIKIDGRYYHKSIIINNSLLIIGGKINEKETSNKMI